jgi:hypothetical protein
MVIKEFLQQFSEQMNALQAAYDFGWKSKEEYVAILYNIVERCENDILQNNLIEYYKEVCDKSILSEYLEKE